MKEDNLFDAEQEAEQVVRSRLPGMLNLRDRNQRFDPVTGGSKILDFGYEMEKDYEDY